MRKTEKDFCILLLSILEHANRETKISEFLNRCVSDLLGFAECDWIGIYFIGDGIQYYEKESIDADQNSSLEAIKSEEGFELKHDFGLSQCKILDFLIENLIRGDTDSLSQFMTRNGSLRAARLRDVLVQLKNAGFEFDSQTEGLFKEYKSLVMIPIRVAEKVIGFLIMKSRQEDYFAFDDVEFYERICSMLGIAILNNRTQTVLRERIKELSCFYGIARIAAEPMFSLDEALQNIVALLPNAWQYPEITVGRVILDGKTYSIASFNAELQCQTSEISIEGIKRGIIEVAYTELMPQLDEGPFLKEERNLLDTIAKLVAQIVERKQVEEDRILLHDQLRHADRLATIGQLAAGVAHEFNEPLGNILGFAQLILKNENLSDDIRKDIDKIITASMHAREVIRKLMLFARQLPVKTTKVNLNKVINEGLYFLEARCTKAGIEVERLLASDLPEILADEAQMHQVLVNLVVNAIQAMPQGGKITITTKLVGKNISLKVADTGLGMSEEIKKQLFIPFFTTKDIDEGTGLGLPVVHGIVISHGGTIKVDSKMGEGSSFEIQLPIKEYRDAGKTIK